MRRSAQSTSGFSLIETLIVLAVVGLLASVAVGNLWEFSSQSRLRLATSEVASILHQARRESVRRNAYVAVRFVEGDSAGADPGVVHGQLFQDGNGNGVRNADIESGVDPPVSPPRELESLGRSIGFGIPETFRGPMPGRSGKRLDRLDDPIRFNRSDLASFGPLGGATPGTLYLRDRRGRMAAVRVLNRSGLIRRFRWDQELEHWRTL